MRLMTNEELLAVSGSGCDTVVASITAAAKSGGKDIPADIKAIGDIAACVGLAETGTKLITEVSNVLNKVDMTGDPMLGILQSNKTYDNYDGPPSGLAGGGNGGNGGKIVEFVMEENVDD